MFNPLHPVVQEAIVGLAGEIAERYKGSPAFKGLSFNMWHSTILWYGSINSGYDDYSVGLFEKETGIEVPVDAAAPDRFSKRHQFLVGKPCEDWLAWRCKKIQELNRRIRDVVVAARPDLRVTYTVVARDNGSRIARATKGARTTVVCSQKPDPFVPRGGLRPGTLSRRTGD